MIWAVGLLAASHLAALAALLGWPGLDEDGEFSRRMALGGSFMVAQVALLARGMLKCKVPLTWMLLGLGFACGAMAAWQSHLPPPDCLVMLLCVAATVSRATRAGGGGQPAHGARTRVGTPSLGSGQFSLFGLMVVTTTIAVVTAALSEEWRISLPAEAVRLARQMAAGGMLGFAALLGITIAAGKHRIATSQVPLAAACIVGALLGLFAAAQLLQSFAAWTPVAVAGVSAGTLALGRVLTQPGTSEGTGRR